MNWDLSKLGSSDVKVKYSKLVIWTTLNLQGCTCVRQTDVGVYMLAEFEWNWCKDRVSKAFYQSESYVKHQRGINLFFTISSAHSPHKCLIFISLMILYLTYFLYLPLTVGQWEVKDAVYHSIQYQWSYSQYFYTPQGNSRYLLTLSVREVVLQGDWK